MSTLGDNVKFLREAKGLTQQELADAIGVTDGSVWSWEQNGVIPRMGAIEKLSQFFNIPKTVLLDGDASKISTIMDPDA